MSFTREQLTYGNLPAAELILRVLTITTTRLTCLHSCGYTPLKFFNNILYAGTDGGFFASSDNGNSFDDYSDGLSVTQFYRISIARNNAEKIVGGTQDNSGFSLKMESGMFIQVLTEWITRLTLPTAI